MNKLALCWRLLVLPSLQVSVSVSLPALGCGSAQEGAGKGSESGADNALVGNPAPDFRVKVAGGSGMVSLRSLRGKVVLVDFWGTFCEPCKKSFPKLQDLYAKFSGSGLKIVGISEDDPDDKDKIPSFARTYGAKFTLGWDDDQVIAKAYKPPTMPSSFIIDKKGIIRYAHAGYHDGEEVQVEHEIRELLGQ